MGDYVYASIEIGGHLETIEETEQLIAALVKEAIKDQHTELQITETETAQTILRAAIENGKRPLELYDEQTNYGTFGEIDEAIKELPRLWCSTHFGSGGGFSEGRKTIVNGDEFNCPTNDGSPMVELSELQALIKGNDPDTIAHCLTRLVVQAERSSGQNLPPLTASPAVAAWLKIFGDKAA